MDLKKYIRNIPDFPTKGVQFKDITTILKKPEVFKFVIDTLVDKYKNEDIDKVVSVEARGYIFGGALAYILGSGFIPVRKPGKLPAKTIGKEYRLEYGTNKIEIHEDAITSGEKVLILDDVLATGGTVLATCQLVEELGGKVVGCAFIANLSYLHGFERLKNYRVFSLIEY
jgi:adenine phosphoribosyltransferase